jgi:formamidopyrimidine-DNA glycosylase
LPELPDVTIYIEALEARILGQTLERVRLASPFLLRTIDPPLAATHEKKVCRLRRIGKRIAIGLEGDLWLVLHLMIAGRLHWREHDAKLPGKNAPAAFDFSNGTLVLTEAGSQKRASLHVVAGEQCLQALDARRHRCVRRRSPLVLPCAHLSQSHAQARPHRSAPVQRHWQRILRRDSAPRTPVSGDSHSKAYA